MGINTLVWWDTPGFTWLNNHPSLLGHSDLILLWPLTIVGKHDWLRLFTVSSERLQSKTPASQAQSYDSCCTSPPPSPWLLQTLGTPPCPLTLCGQGWQGQLKWLLQNDEKTHRGAAMWPSASTHWFYNFPHNKRVFIFELVAYQELQLRS